MHTWPGTPSSGGSGMKTISGSSQEGSIPTGRCTGGRSSLRIPPINSEPIQACTSMWQPLPSVAGVGGTTCRVTSLRVALLGGTLVNTPLGGLVIEALQPGQVLSTTRVMVASELVGLPTLK